MYRAFGVYISLFFLAPLPAMAAGVVTQSYGGRDMLIYVPPRLPAEGSRALVVVLHGGLGNAERIESRHSESGLNMDAEADKDGFIVVYLNGTPVTRLFGNKMLGWNAGGGCCGQSAANNIDDVGYISGAVNLLTRQYGIDRAKVYGIGHSNGAMMTQRMICESNVYSAGVAVSGPLNEPINHCLDAKGMRVLAIHGADDENVPIAGGVGSKGLSKVSYASEAQSQRIMQASGVSYTLDIVPSADHKLDDIDAALQKAEGTSIAEKAVRFFGLVH
jgi:polyhydroxybutyrate depolymerase